MQSINSTDGSKILFQQEGNKLSIFGDFNIPESEFKNLNLLPVQNFLIEE
jgi:hypothetical protein